jgi:hypothetical protein
MTMAGMLAATIVLVLSLVGGAVATDAFERTAGHSWGSDADTGNVTLVRVAPPLSASALARARLLCRNQRRHRHMTAAALSACAISSNGDLR